MSGQVTANGNYVRRATGFALQTVTVSCWFRLNTISPGTFQQMWSQDDNATFYPGLFTDGVDLQMITDIGSGPVNLLTGISAGVWYWAAVVGGTVTTSRGYARAGLGSIAAVAGPVGGGFSSPRMTVYNDDANDQQLGGQLVSYKLWTAELSLKELMAESLLGLPKRTQDLYTFLPLIGGGTGAGIDQNGNGNDFALTGAIASSRLMPPICWSR